MRIKTIFLILICFFTSLAFADEGCTAWDDPSSIQLDIETDLDSGDEEEAFERAFADSCLSDLSSRDPKHDNDFSFNPQPSGIQEMEGLPSGVVEGVSVISGHYNTVELDGYVIAPSDFSMERSYLFNHSYKNAFTGLYWRYTHIWSIEAHENASTWVVKEGSGSSARYNSPLSSAKYERAFDYKGQASGLTNAQGGILSGQTSIKNGKINSHKSKNCKWVLQEGNGTRRSFNENERQSLEERPDKSVLRYSYDKNKRITSISLQNSKQTREFASAKFFYPTPSEWRLDPHVDLVLSNSGKIRISFVDKHMDTMRIKSVTPMAGPKVEYAYSDKKDKLGYLLTKRILPEGREEHFAYYLDNKETVAGEKFRVSSDFLYGRVKELLRPVGINGEMHPVQTFVYRISKGTDGVLKKGTTEVYDALGNKSEYQYNGKRRISSICSGNRKQSFIWDESKKKSVGNLLSRSWEDAEGRTLAAYAYTYDKNGNVVKKEFSGALTAEGMQESITWHYTYSSDRFNLLLSETDCCGQKTQYTYLRESNLPTSKLILDAQDKKIKSRTFFEYDKDHILVKRIEDDGSGTASTDLTGATFRKVITLSPSNKMGSYGKPVKMVESYYDFEKKVERVSKTVEHTYTPFGLIASERVLDENGSPIGKTATFEYNSHNKLVREVDNLGREAFYSYDANGNRISCKKTHQEFETRYYYDTSNRLVREEEIYGDQIFALEFLYDLKSQKIQKTDSYGNVTKYAYNSHGEVIAITHPPLQDGSCPIERFAYDAMGNCIEKIDGLGHRTTYLYNSRKQLLKVTFPDGSFESSRYNLDGTLAEKTAEGKCTRITYDGMKRPCLVEEFGVDGSYIGCKKMQYRGSRPISESDLAGNLTVYNYDIRGRKASECQSNIRGDDVSTSFAYDTLDNVIKTSQKTPTGYKSLCKTYDAASRVTEEWTEDETGIRTGYVRYSYDLDDRKIEELREIENQQFARTQYFYDSLGDLALQIDPCGNSFVSEHNHRTLTPLGTYVLQSTTIDPLGRKSVVTYDAYSHPATEQRYTAAGQLIQQSSHTYDAAANKLKTESIVFKEGVEQRRSAIVWEYDPQGRVTKTIEAPDTPEEKVSAIHYDSYGRKSLLIKNDGNRLYFAYDAAGNLISLTDENRTLHHAFQYDLLGHIIAAEDCISGEKISRTYDGVGNAIFEEINGLCISRQYDCLGRKEQLTLPDGSRIRWNFDSLQLKSVERANSQGEALYRHTYDAYSPQGHWLKATTCFGSEISRAFDPLQRLIEISSPFFSHTIPSEGYDAVGNLKACRITDLQGSYAQTFLYDDRNNLKQEEGYKFHRYIHDSLDNLCEKDGMKGSVNALNQIEELGSKKLSYDRNGNTIQKNDQDTLWIYEYDALDRLISAEQPSNIRLTFSYDPFHRRLSKKTEKWTGSSWRVCEHKRFIYDDQNEIGSIDSLTGMQCDLRLLGHGDGAEISAAVAIETQPYELFVPYHDIQGNVRALVNDKQCVVSAYRYTAFGCVESLYSNGLKCPWQFSSKRYDEESSLTYFGRRYYTSDLGRWINPDPKGFEDGLNVYAYVKNAPLTNRDLYGLRSTIPRLQQLKSRIRIDYGFEMRCFRANPQRYQPYSNYGLNSDKKDYACISHDLLGIGAKELQNPNLYVTMMGGINTRFPNHFQNTCHLSDAIDGHNLIGVYNPTHGLFTDLWECLKGLRYIFTDPVKELHKTWDDCFKKSGDATFILHYAYSQGAIHARNALETYDQERAKHITVVAIAPAAYIDSDNCERVRHYYSKSLDFVPHIDKRGFWREMRRGNVEALERDARASLFDHSFQSPTYKQVIRKEFDKFIDAHTGK